MDKTDSSLCDVCIVRTDDGLDWSDFLEGTFISPEEEQKVKFGHYDVSVFSVGRDGTVQPINQPPLEEDGVTPRKATGKFLVVVVTPNLIKLLHEHGNLGFWDHDPSKTWKAIFLCGIEPVQLFETDDCGRTLSERFQDYSSWTKYGHANYDKLIDSAVAWIKSGSPAIPGRRDTTIGRQSATERCDDDDDDDDNDDGDYIFMQRPLSDEDKSSSKTSSKNTKDSDEDDGEYIGNDNFRGNEKRLTDLDGLDTYGLGTFDGRESKKNSTISSVAEEFSIVPEEAVCEDSTTIVVIFRESPLDKSNHCGSQRKDAKKNGAAFNVTMIEGSFTRRIDLVWINPTVAYFQAPTHHPGTVQVKIMKNNEDVYGAGVSLEYKRSQGVEEVVSEVSQIYIHLLSISFGLLKFSGQSPSPAMGSSPGVLLGLPVVRRGSTLSNSVSQLDRNLSGVFRDSSDIDQFNVRAFEYFFTAYNSDESSTQLPTALHLAAKHNLPQLASVLLELPESKRALTLQNSARMNPLDIAKGLNHEEVVNIFEDFLNSPNMNHQEAKDLACSDLYLDMEQNTRRRAALPDQTNSIDDDDDDEQMKKGALNKSQEELIDIMDMVKKKGISVREAQILFSEWKLRHKNDEQEKNGKPEEVKRRGIKEKIGYLFGASNKKTSSYSPLAEQQAVCSKRHTSRNSETGSADLPSIPPRASPAEPPQPPQLPRMPHDYLPLRDGDDDDDTYLGRSDANDTSSPLVPPPRKTRWQNAKQTSFPASLNPPTPHIFPRKCSLPDNKRQRINQQSNLGSTPEASEGNKDPPSHGYISMSSPRWKHKN